MTKQKTSKRQLNVLLAAGVPVVLAVSSAAMAQFQVNTGNALDANNKGGAGGSNTPINQYTQPQPLYTGNQIVTGNVTQGRGLRTNVGYTDPNALRTQTAGQRFETFSANSVGVPQSYQPTVPAYVAPRAYLGQSKAAEVPAGYRLSNFTGTYTATAAPRAQGYTTQVNQAPTDGYNPRDLGLMTPNLADTSSVTGAPLYTGGDAGFQGYSNYLRVNSPDSLRLNDKALEQMRVELNQTIAPRLDTNPPGQQQKQRPGAGLPEEQGTDQNAQVGITAQSLTGQALGTPQQDNQGGASAGNAQANGAGQQGGLTPSALGAAPMSDRLGAPQQKSGAKGATAAASVVPPSRQSSQYAQLQQRLTQFESQMGTTPGQPGQPGRPGQPGVLGQPQVPGARVQQQQPPVGAVPGVGTDTGADTELMPQSRREREKAKADAEKGLSATERDRRRASAMYPPSVPNKPAPLEVKSLATGVQAKGLHDLLADAERLMRDQKYGAALERYDAAERVAPNNPLVWLGRAHTELAAGYYARADRDLRNALTTDRALLMGRYDLEKFLGSDRLNGVATDLKQIANKEKDDVTSAFLLAYIAYNTNNPDRAAEYLNLAERRAGGPDPMFKLLRQHWTLPEVKDGEGATKP